MRGLVGGCRLAARMDGRDEFHFSLEYAWSSGKEMNAMHALDGGLWGGV